MLSVRRILGWMRGASRRVRDVFPLTAAGVLAAAASAVAALYYGRERLDHLLLAVGGVGLALVALGAVSVIASSLLVRRWAHRAGRAEALQAECGVLVPTGFRVRRPWWLPLVHVRWSWLEPRAEVEVKVEAGFAHEQVIAAGRDRFTAIVRRFEIEDVFGLARIAFRAREVRAGRFAPSVGGLAHMHVAHGLSGGDALAHHEGSPSGDYYDTRRYGPGDPIRFVLWKVFARTRELLVRTPEPAASPDRRTIAYLVTGAGDEPAAGAARVAVDSGALGTQWILGADGCPDPVSSKDQALDLLARSARARAEDGGGLGAFLGRSAAGAMARALVFVPARPGPWLDRVTRAAGGVPGQLPRVEFIVCTDGIAARARRSALARALSTEKPPTDIATHEELVAVLDALGKTGANVLVVDRPNGRIVPARTIRGASA